MRCAIYVRVSTQEQFDEGFSIPAQKERLKAFCMSQGWKVVKEYVEEGYSAKDTNRPQLQALLSDLKKGVFDIVLVYRLDRLTRSVLDLYNLMKTFEDHNVSFKSASEVYDTSTAMGRLFITLVAALAEWERNNLAERVKFGTQQMVEQGIRPGSPRPYGYEYVDGKLKMVKEEAKWVKFIFDKYITNGAQTIARELNQMGVKNKKGGIWNGSSIRYIVENPLYAGLLRWDFRGKTGGKRVFNDDPTIVELKQEGFEPIISVDDFNRVRLLLKSRHKNQVRSTTHYPFSTVLRCSECGHKYVGRTEIRQPNNRKYRSYSCQGNRKYGVCKAPSFSEDAINETFIKSLEYTIEQVDISVSNEVDPLDLRSALNKIQNKKERAKELYIEGDIAKKRYQELMLDYNEEENELKGKLEETDEYISGEEIKKLLSHIKDEWNQMDYETQKKAIQSLFDSITIKVIKKGTAGKNPKPAVLEIIDYQLR